MTETKLNTNLDTNLLKLIAIASMLVDHVGGALYPDAVWMRCVGRLAFPIFCYCMTVGLLYTHDIRRYLLRLGLFALISQPFYVLAFHPHDFWSQFTNWNIFFTLFLSLLAMYGIQSHRWWLFALALFAVCWWNFDYSGNGVILMLIFYLCRRSPKWMGILYTLFYLPVLFYAVGPLDPMALSVGGFLLDAQIFALLALPLLLIPMRVPVKLPKWFFYAFYPAHLAAIAALQFLI